MAGSLGPQTQPATPINQALNGLPMLLSGLPVVLEGLAVAAKPDCPLSARVPHYRFAAEGRLSRKSSSRSCPNFFLAVHQ